MSWSDKRAFAVVFAALLALSACTLTPAYRSEAGPGVTDRIGYAEPESRAEQVIYQALKFALGDGAPLLLSVTTTSEIAPVSRVASVDPATPYSLTMTARYTLADHTDPDTHLLSETRTASATFTRGPQQSANAAAQADAEERAAHRLAEIIRARLLIYLRDTP